MKEFLGIFLWDIVVVSIIILCFKGCINHDPTDRTSLVCGMVLFLIIGFYSFGWLFGGDD